MANPSPGAPQGDAATRSPARERLLAAADELFHREGINNVGIDRVLAHAGVAKASLYAHFRSKEELVRAYLDARQQARRARILRHVGQRRSPRERLLAVFDALAEGAQRPDFRGCTLAMASAELPASDAAREVREDYRAWLRALLLGLCKEAGARKPAALAGQLLLLVDGALASAQMDGSSHPVQTARSIAAALLDAAVSR
jgi:AcrR family transcriptional regulator